jgi:hypothetical protein
MNYVMTRQKTLFGPERQPEQLQQIQPPSDAGRWEIHSWRLFQDGGYTWLVVLWTGPGV